MSFSVYEWRDLATSCSPDFIFATVWALVAILNGKMMVVGGRGRGCVTDVVEILC